MADYRVALTKAGTGERLFPETTANQVILKDGSRLEKEGKINADTLSGFDGEKVAHYGDFEILWEGLETNGNITLSKPMSEFRYLWFGVGASTNSGEWVNTRLVPVKLFKTRFCAQTGHNSLLFDLWNDGYVCVYSPNDTTICAWNSSNAGSLQYVAGIK